MYLSSDRSRRIGRLDGVDLRLHNAKAALFGVPCVAAIPIAPVSTNFVYADPSDNPAIESRSKWTG